MRVIASPEAVELVHLRGGRLFVWTKRGRCCGAGLTWLEASIENPGGRDFERIDAPFDLYVALGGHGPEELHVDACGRRRRRVEAYWNGCAWVV